MRKRISSQPQRESPSANTGWLYLEALARVEVTSEDAGHPIESALLTVGATGWRAESPGEQTIRLLFEAPQRLRRIRLLFREEKEVRIAKSSISKRSYSFQKTIDLREKNAVFHDQRRVHDRRVKTSSF